MVKVKGLKVDISYYHLNSINNKYASSIIEQEKWFYKLEKSAIIVKSDRYTLALNENKREVVYNSWGDFIDTIALYLNDGVLEKRNTDALHYLPAPSIQLLDEDNLSDRSKHSWIDKQIFRPVDRSNHSWIEMSS